MPPRPRSPAEEIAAVRRDVSVGVAAARAGVSRPGDPRLRARALVPARLDHGRPRGGRGDARHLLPGRASTTSRSSSSAAVTASCGLLQRLPSPRHGRRRGAVRQGGPLPVPVPRLDLRPRRLADPRQAHRGPRRLQPRGLPGCGRSVLELVAGLRVRQPRPGAPALEDRLGDLGRPSRAVRLQRRCASRHGRPTRSTPTGNSIAENYSECYHCPGIHPQLNKLTPYDLGGDYAPDGPWQGGWMELVDDAETMALDGGHRSRRPSGDGRHHRAGRPADLLLPRSGRDVPVDPSGLPARPPARAGRRRITRGSSATGCSSRRPSPRPASTRPTRSPSGTSPTARTGTSASSSSGGRARAAGSPAGTPTRSRASTRST